MLFVFFVSLSLSLRGDFVLISFSRGGGDDLFRNLMRQLESPVRDYDFQEGMAGDAKGFQVPIKVFERWIKVFTAGKAAEGVWA